MKDRKWFIKIENPKTKVCFTVCDNGTVYSSEKFGEIFALNEKGLNKLNEIIKPNMYMLRTMRYFKQRKEGYVIKINDTSRKHKDIIKIVGWTYENQILNILKNSEFIKEVF